MTLLFILHNTFTFLTQSDGEENTARYLWGACAWEVETLSGLFHEAGPPAPTVLPDCEPGIFLGHLVHVRPLLSPDTITRLNRVSGEVINHLTGRKVEKVFLSTYAEARPVSEATG